MAKLAKILCVEDDQDMQKMLMLVLGKAGYDVTIAPHGRAGIEKAKEYKPDLIIMDIHMPDISGIQAIRRIKAEAFCQDIPIIVLSAHKNPKLVDDALSAGAEFYLEKALMSDKLINVVKQYL